VFAKIGSAKSTERTNRGLNKLVWLLTALIGIGTSHLCEAQIEVDAYITDPLSGKVFVFNTATNTSVGAPILAGSLPIGVAVSPDGRYTYVTNNGNSTLSIIDTVTHVVVGSTNVGTGPIGVAVTPNGKYVYVTSPGPIMNNNGFVGNTVSVINAATNALVGSITVGTGPIGIALTPDGKFAYVGNNGSDVVSVINTAANTVVSSIANSAS